MTLLLLARHAAHGELDHALSGRRDTAGLTETGRTQAARLGTLSRIHRPVALFTSPRRRASETAALLGDALALPPRIIPELDEIEFGAWTGRAMSDLVDEPAWRSWNEQRATARPPGGEAMHEVLSRVLRWTEGLHLAFPGAALVAVSHADVIKAAVAAYLGLTLDAHWRFDIAPASVSAIELWPGGGRLRFVNTTAED